MTRVCQRPCAADSGHEVPGQQEEVCRDDRGTDIAGEGLLALPGAAGEAEDALEEGDHAFDAGAEVAELAVDPGARCHVIDAEATLLGEDDIVEAPYLGCLEVVLAGECGVGGR